MKSFLFFCFSFLVFFTCAISQPSWRKIKSQTALKYNKDLNSVKFVDQKNGYAIGIHELIKSTDGGHNWEKKYSFSYPNVFPDIHLQVRVMDFVDSLHGMLARSNGDVHTTKDGGTSFTTITIDNFSIRGMDMVTKDIAYVCGGPSGDSLNSALIYKTLDGGQTWNSQLSTVPYALIDVRFLNPLVGWACGVGGVINTTDGGATWTVVSGLPYQSFLQVQFADVNNGYALSGDGKLFKTTNSGLVWLLMIDLEGDSGFQVMEFINPDTGMVCDFSGGHVFLTNDGGTNWVKEKTLRINQDITFLDNNHAWTVGFSDSIALYSIPTVSINNPPIIKDKNGNLVDTLYDSTNKNTALKICMSVSDLEGDGVDITSAYSLTDNGTINLMPIGDTCLTYSPKENFVGKDTLKLLVCDNGSPSMCDSVVLIVVVNLVDPNPSKPTANFEYSKNYLSIQFIDATLNSPTSWFWDFGDGESSSVQNPLHLYPANGTYQACLKVSNLAGTDSICKTLIVTIPNGVESIHLEPNVAIYPNPTKGLIHFEQKKHFQLNRIRLLTIEGRELINIQQKNISNSIDLNFIPNGFYILEFFGRDEKIIRKIEKQSD